MPAFLITLVSCNDICFQSGRVVEPLVIEDVPSSTFEERMNQQYLSNETIPIIKDVEIPTETLAETQEEKSIDTQFTQLVREPPYPERLILPKVVGQPQFNLLGELKNLYVKITLLQAFMMCLSMPQLFKICVQENQEEKPGILPLSML